MPDFYVNPPNYRAADYSWLGNLPNQFYQGAQEKQQYDLSHAFSNGVPMNPDGTVNAQALLQIYGKNGDVGDIPKLSQMALQQQQLRQSSNLSPLLAPVGGGSAPVTPSASAAAVPSQSAQPPNAPRFSGDTVSAIVDSVVPQAAKSGVVARNVARAVGVDPTATLTPEQARKTQSLITGYLTRTGQIAPDSASAPRGIRNNNPGNIEDGNFARSQPGYAGTEAKGRFATFDTPQDGLNAAATLIGRYSKAGINTISGIVNKWAPASDGNNTGNYAAAVAKTLGVDPNQPLDLSSPKTRLAVASAMSDFENGQHSAAQPQGHPITPTVPLPRGYTDPEQAILGIDREIARLGNNPYAKGQVAALEDWRNRIADSVKPIKVGMYDTYVDPRSGRPLTEGAYAQGNAAETGATLDLDAQRYLQTGTLPPNMGRGLQGAAQATAIRARAQELATEQGIDPATLPERWQAYRAHQAGLQRFTSGPQGNAVRSFNVLVDHLGTLDQAAAALHNGNIKAFNHVANAIAEQTGRPAPTNFAATKALVGDEIVKAIVGGGGALGDREEVKRAIDAANSPEQLAGVIEQYKRLALGQLRGLRKQYEVSTGQSNFNDLLSPGTLKFFGGGAESGGSAKPSGSPQRVTTEAEYNALPKGTHYIAPDGSSRIKQ